MEITSFSDIVGDEDVFWAQHFDRRPLHRRKAISNPDDFLSIQDLDEVLRHERLRSAQLLMVRDGEVYPPHAYTERIRLAEWEFDSYVDPEGVYRLFNAGASMVWAGIQNLHPKAHVLSRLLAQELNTRCDVMAFVTPGSWQGLGIHDDPSDTYVIQLSGIKRWRIWATPVSRNLGHYRLSSDMDEPQMDVSMEPGDILYVPYGTPHAMIAEEDTSLHITATAPPILLDASGD
ncbi:JmjC domain-containing protein [Streptomyces chartreusis]|uniref:JmjC domain-containing protein n=1 Tax=Streptomyces chartreusis TaxID=1969 RepID=UPI00368DB0A4